LLTCFLLSKS